MRQLFLRAITVAVLLSASSVAFAQSFTYNTTLVSQKERLTPNNSTSLTGAIGYGSVAYDDVDKTLTMNLKTYNLAANISGAHIHIVANNNPNPTSVNGPVRLDYVDLAGLTGPIASSANVFVFPEVVVNINTPTLEGFVNDIRNGFAYYNVHNAGNLTENPGYTGPANFAGGQIRGNLIAAPEPASFAFVGLTIFGAVAVRRRKK